MNNKDSMFHNVMASTVKDMNTSLAMLLQSFEANGALAQRMSDEHKQSFSNMHYEVARLQNNLFHLHTLYRIQYERLPIVQEEHFVHEFLEEQVLSVNGLFVIGDVKVKIECCEDMSAYFDFELVSSIIITALVNASRYTKDEVIIRAISHDDGILIQVDDNSRGFPDTILDRFKEGIQDKSEEFNEQGLGWLYCNEIAKSHENRGRAGYVALSNDSVLSGSRFAVWLP
ncbi:MAG: sensor histidine kinase [Marinomonas sp.]|uniref:sensor histidine kinase n=1 Tax=unclassified Marinomonas TaxID=196814 RepID=UPI0005F9CE70|nr:MULTISPECIES: HAMP domain-containing sensor histidine kinase [unclassified Marinomonas]KJZ12893.1 hypothetical protein TW85_14155 [Marinomonas sp. S3726]KZM38725.1 hypothetical protein OA92_22550 [Marinomonas sp. SBI22]KZM39380.1 hypothetical protein OA91_22400 [Marinomonas sp. SBI8L]